MEHREAIALLEARLDRPLSQVELGGLQQHLLDCAKCRAHADRLSALEARLNHSLPARFTETPLNPATKAAVLFILNAHTRRRNVTRNLIRTAATLALAATFIVTLSWAIRIFTQRAPLGVGQTDVPVNTSTIPASPVTNQASTPSLAPTPTISLPFSRTSSIFPNLQFSFRADLPAKIEKVMLYTQQPPEPATLESIKAIASRLALDAPVYQRPGEVDYPIYEVSDGFNMLRFPDDTAEIYHYWLDYGNSLTNPEDRLAPDQIIEIARTYAEEHGLLDTPYKVETMPEEPGGVRFVRLLDGRPVIYGIGHNPSLVDLEVIVGPDGKVQEVRYAARHFQAVGEFPILSAEQAWQRFIDSPTGDRLRYAINPPSQPGQLRSWIRQYPIGERIDLYGYASLFQPAEPAGQPLAMFGNWPVVGDNAANFASQASVYDFLHTWGQLITDAEGRQTFQIEGWEVSPLEDLILMGTLERIGDQAWLNSEQGRFSLPDLPADVRDGTTVNVRGVLLDGQTLEWSYLDNNQFFDGGYGVYEGCAGGGGGGSEAGFGGGTFVGVSLSPVADRETPTSVPPPSPYQIGDIIEAASGTVMAVQHRYADGSEILEVYLRPELWSWESLDEYWQARLFGPGTEGLEQYNNMPIRVWGKVTSFTPDGWPVIEVERFEEIYLGLRFQAWLGTWEPVTLEGQEVLLFTTLEGQQYVLSGSIHYDAEKDAIGLPGDRVVIEGLAIPGNNFDGYPVIDEFGGGIANDMNDLSGYQITAGEPGVWDETDSNPVQADQLQGVIKIDKVDLVYAAASLQKCGNNRESDPEKAPWLIVQPIWRFSGNLEDGRTFEVQIQALPDEYLTSP